MIIRRNNSQLYNAENEKIKSAYFKFKKFICKKNSYIINSNIKTNI